MLHKIELSGELARNLLDAAPDPTVIVDSAGVIVFANARTEEVFGYAPAELVGQPVEMLMPERYRSAHPDHRRRFGHKAESRPMGAGLELYGLHKDGHEFPVEISLSPLVTPAGLLISSAIRDVSAQRATERALADADRAKSRFLAAASHDLRQPLQALSLLTRAARRRTAGDTELARLVERQQKALNSMTSLLNSLLDISKFDSGRISPSAADCSLAEVFSELCSNFQEQAEEKGLVLHAEDNGLVVHTDPQLLKQLLSNLLSNAIRYTSSGEVCLRALVRGQRAHIEVRDTGIGIPANERERVFDEFYQVDHPSRRPEGLGLGLSIVRRIAALLQTPVTLDAGETSGTVFDIAVPLGTTAQPAVSSTPPVPSATGGGHILIIDDEAAVADATGLLLELEGFNVELAATEADALACIEHHAPDLIISDFHLRTGATGVDVVRTLRDRLAQHTPVVFVSGDTSGMPRAEAVPNAQFLTKPLTGDELLAAVHRGIATGERERN